MEYQKGADQPDYKTGKHFAQSVMPSTIRAEPNMPAIRINRHNHTTGL